MGGGGRVGSKGGGVRLGGGKGRCEQRKEVFVKIQKNGGGVGSGVSGSWGVRVDVNEELKFL